MVPGGPKPKRALLSLDLVTEKWSGASRVHGRNVSTALMGETPPDQTWELDQIGNDRWGSAGGRQRGQLQGFLPGRLLDQR